MYIMWYFGWFGSWVDGAGNRQFPVFSDPNVTGSEENDF
jgi:hypothetical protein